MWTRRGVKVDVFAEHVGEMSLLQNQQVVKTFVSNGVHPPLSNGIGFRRSKRRLHDVGAFGDDDQVKVGRKFAIAILNEVPGERDFFIWSSPHSS
jgi:hypothetical protein